MESAQTVITPIPPFDFDGTVYVPHYFPTPDFEWQHNLMWQTLNLNRRLFGLRMQNKGVVNDPQIKLAVYSENKLTRNVMESVLKELNWRYGFDEDNSDFYKEFRNDKFLKPAFKRLGGMRVNCANSLYELLIISIVLQNATVKRTVQMMNNLFNAYGTLLKFDNKELFAYWNAEDLNGVDEEELRALKVGYRAKMVKRMSEAFARKEIDELTLRKMKTEDAKQELMKLYGVGPATAEIVLSGYLRRYDTFDLKGKFWGAEDTLKSNVQHGVGSRTGDNRRVQQKVWKMEGTGIPLYIHRSVLEAPRKENPLARERGQNVRSAPFKKEITTISFFFSVWAFSDLLLSYPFESSEL